MLSTQIPVKFALPFAANAGGPYTHQVPTPSQITITPGAASMNDGFPPLCFQPVGSGGVPPFGQDFNGLLNQISAWSQWQAAGGPVTWDSAFSTSVGGYPKGAIVQSTVTLGLQWLSLVDNNTSNPDSGGAGWTSLGLSAGRVVSDSSAQTVTLGFNRSVRIATGTVPYTLPLSSTLFNGFEFSVYTVSGTVTFAPNAGDNFQGYGTGVTYTASPNSWIRIVTNGAGLWIATPGGWNNGRVSITSAQTVGPQHKGATLDLTSGTFFALAFPAASSLQPDFFCTIVNNEATPIAKGVSGVGVSNWRIYPTQSFEIFNNNGSLCVRGHNTNSANGTPDRWRQQSVQFFVDTGLGSNNPLVADGLAPGARAYASITQMLADAASNFDFLGSLPTATVAAGTYNESPTMPILVGANVMFINGAAPVTYNANGFYSTGVLWQPVGGGAACLIVGDGSKVEVSNIFMNGNVSIVGSGVAIQIHQFAACDWNGGGGVGSFGAGGYHFGCDGAGGTFNMNASYHVSGDGTNFSGGNHFQWQSMCAVNISGSITVTLSTGGNAANFNGGSWFRQSGSEIGLAPAITFANRASVLSCVQWGVGPMAALTLNGNGAGVPGTAGSPAIGSAPTAITGWVS